tara:strand:+ start:1379 stop:3499 length:2121 start_codon:yes stop_codon:yes gene_type:complete
MAIENLIKMAEQVSRLGDQDLAMLTKEEGIQSVLAATEMKDRERVRSEVPVMNMNQPTVIDNLINRTLGMNRQVDPTAMPMPSPDMMGNMPMEAPNMPPMQQTMPNGVDPRMLAQQPPMARMGGLLRRFAPGGLFNEEYVKAVGEDSDISMAKYNQIISPRFQDKQLGLYDSDTSRQLRLAENELTDFNITNSILNNPAKETFENRQALETKISSLDDKLKDETKAVSELQSLRDQGFFISNPQYFDLKNEAGGDPSKLLELIRLAETDKKIDKDSEIDENTRASTDGDGVSDILPNQVNQSSDDQGSDDQGSDDQDNTQTTGGQVTIDKNRYGDQTRDVDNSIENEMRNKIVGALGENLGTTLSGYTNDVTRKSALTKSIEEKDKVDMELLGTYQKNMDAAEKALNDISETDFPSRKEIIDRNKQQVKLGIASAFFNAAATGKPSFMESMGQAFGDASAVMAKGTAKEQKDLMQLAIADYNRASKKFDIAQGRRDKLSSEINTRLTNRATLEQSNRDFRFELEKEETRKLEKITELMGNNIQEAEARRQFTEDMSFKVDAQFVKNVEELRSDEFAKVNMPKKEIEGVAAIQLGDTGVKYSARAQSVINDGIQRFQREIDANIKKLSGLVENASLSEEQILEKAKEAYSDKLRDNEEHGSLDIYETYYPLIESYVEKKATEPQNREANIAFMQDKYPWMSPSIYGE